METTSGECWMRPCEFDSRPPRKARVLAARCAVIVMVCARVVVCASTRPLEKRRLGIKTTLGHIAPGVDLSLMEFVGGHEIEGQLRFAICIAPTERENVAHETHAYYQKGRAGWR